MTSVQLSDRLRTALIELMDVEATIQTTLSDLKSVVEPHPDARAQVADIEVLANGHIDAIRARLSSVGDDDFTVPASPTSTRSDRDFPERRLRALESSVAPSRRP